MKALDILYEQKAESESLDLSAIKMAELGYIEVQGLGTTTKLWVKDQR